MAEVGFFGEVPPDLRIRIQSGLGMTEQFEDEPVAVNDRSVALFGGTAANGKRCFGRSSDVAELFPQHTSNQAVPGVNLAPTLDQRKQIEACLVVEDPVVQQASDLRRYHRTHDRVRSS